MSIIYFAYITKILWPTTSSYEVEVSNVLYSAVPTLQNGTHKGLAAVLSRTVGLTCEVLKQIITNILVWLIPVNLPDLSGYRATRMIHLDYIYKTYYSYVCV